MKAYRIIISLLLLSLPTSFLSAQDTVLTFYNKKGELVKKKKKDGHYAKSILLESRKYIEAYDGADDKLLKKGFYKADNDTIADGHFVIYKNGSTHEGDYRNNYKVGEWRALYASGQKRYEVSFLNATDSIEPILRSDSSLYYLIRNEEGLYDGTCKWYRRNGKIACQEEYTKGRLISVFLWDTMGVKLAVDASDYGYQRMPLFQGSLPQFLKSNLVYPDKAVTEKKQGKVIVGFMIDENGKVSDINIKQSSGYWELDREAENVVERTDGWWLPGTQHNLPVSIYYVLPVTFKL